MIKVYPALIHNENGYWIEFPDLEGCQAVGDSFEELMGEASEALGLYLVAILEDGKDLPEASDLAKLNPKKGVETTYICTDVDKYRRDTRAVKKMLSIPAWLAKEAEEKNISLSKVLQEALKQKVSML